MKSPHYPVMYREVVELFAESSRKLFVDCTVGLGGHSGHILRQIPGSAIAAIDVDEESLELARKNLGEFGRRVRFFKGDFTGLFERIPVSPAAVGGVLVDPGISQFQLKSPERGFSHSLDGPLDMRKDRSAEVSAADVINRFPQDRLTEIFRDFGEVADSRALAKRIVERRLFGPISSTVQLRCLLEELSHRRPRKGETHPAAKVFQALRIFVNRELENLETFLLRAGKSLGSGARIILLSYHSLEDRIFKNSLKRMAREGSVRILPPFPRFPSAVEIAENPASRSAKLRVAEVA